ncbi:hypothetical protein N7492_000076 [Penicillium capsulatum]|uniref:CTLH domain-containing protein n=1 Tax=Penicillium capsulatum TaxID=69766 RepID=A0A9W9ISV3_9EURO|nr:hypothetical protein N7492_000076 [Penicillium capsulatum]KAJ6130851.1 hypothetical protein N7512_003631 [Penicillium capsulatum]
MGGRGSYIRELTDATYPFLSPLDLLTWFFARAGTLGRSPYTIDLADHPPRERVTSDHPDLPLPLDSTTPAGTRNPTPSASFLTASSQPPSSAFVRPANLRRRRVSSSSSDTSASFATGNAFPSEETGAREALPQDIISHPPSRTAGHPPSRKRRRLVTMRADAASKTNGFSQASNGSTPRKVSLNGSSSAFANGGSHTNGAGKSSTNSTYYGHDREEVTRILIQSLYELGYNGAASTLTSESGYQLETSGVATFRSAVLGGRWFEAERILILSFRHGGSNDRKASPEETLVLAEDADKNEMLFYLRQQKFLELLELRDFAAALVVLRQELTPLNFDVDRLHALSSLLMCPPELLHEQAGWDGPVSSSRERLLADLSKSISPSVMIPQHRLAILLDHVKQTQISNCLYHNTAASPSLYSDHMCDRSDFPLDVSIDLNQHSDEVWYCEFSHDGTKLVTAGKDRTVLIYDTRDFGLLHKLADHGDGVAFASWSPDDSKLITCSQDKKARVWDVETGYCLLTIDHHNQPVTAAGWAPDGESFVTASFDSSSQLCLWSIRGPSLYMWKGAFRVADCAISPDGRRLVAIDTESNVHVFDFRTYEEDYCLSLPCKATSVTISRDSKFMLVNLSQGEIQLIDLETTNVVRRFRGQKQGEFVIRSTFGGAGENFVVSGSEDSRVYIWHRENGSLVETLAGHVAGCVNSIAWNPTNPGMFASAGDDNVLVPRARSSSPNESPRPATRTIIKWVSTNERIEEHIRILIPQDCKNDT